MRLDDLQGTPAAVARVGTQVLAAPLARCLALDHDGLQHCVELRARHAHWPRSRRATTGRHGRPPAGGACCPFFPRSVGLRPTASCASGALNIAPSMLCQRQAMPSIWSYSAKPGLPQGLEHASRLPLQESLVDGAGAAEALLGQRLPLAARAQHVHDRLEHLSRRLGWPPRAGLAHVLLVRSARAHRNQRLHALPEIIRHHPRLHSLACRHASRPDAACNAARIESLLFTDNF